MLEQRLKQGVAAVLRLFFHSIPLESVSLDGIKAILVVRQHDQLGDMLCLVPTLRALRTRFSRARIWLIASPVNYDIMRHHPLIDDVILFDKRALIRSPWAGVRFYRLLRSLRADLAIVPATVSVSLTSNLIAFLSGAGIRVGPERLEGAPNATAFLFNVRVALGWGDGVHWHQTQRTLDVLRPLGTDTGNLQLEIGLTPGEEEEAARWLVAFRAEHPVLVGMHPGAGKPENRWPAERFAEVANGLYERNRTGVVITAGPMDDEPVNMMLRHLRCPYLLVRHKPIRLVAAVAKHTKAFIANDTGIMHVAAATGVPTLSLFGPTDPLQWAPAGARNRYIQAKSGDIQLISVQEVLENATEMLSLAG